MVVLVIVVVVMIAKCSSGDSCSEGDCVVS
jgi:hypothetical protein